MKIKWVMLVAYSMILFSAVSVGAARLPTIGGDNETWGQILNEFLNVTLAESGILRMNSVNATTIMDGSVSQTDLAPNSVNSSTILNNALTNEDISGDADINVSKLNSESGSGEYVIVNAAFTSWGKITNVMILDGTLTAAKFVLGTITGNYIASGAINSSHIQESAVTSSKVAPGAINASHVSTSSINTSHLSSDVLSLISSVSVANGSITAEKLSIGSVNTTHILNGTIQNEDLAASANISLSKIESLTDSHRHDASNITSGTLSVVRGGTGLASYTFGDLLYAASSSNLTLLSIGSNGTILMSNGTAPRWTTPSLSSNPSTNSVNSSTIIDGSVNASDLAIGSVNSTHILDLTIIAQDIANGIITAAKLVAGIITADYIAVAAVNTTHILDNTIKGEDINTTTNVTVNLINATVFEIGLETKTAECSSSGCTATATCTSGKTVLYGYGASAGLLSGLSIGSATADCTAGLTSCAVTESDVLLNQASVRIVCAKVR